MYSNEPMHIAVQIAICIGFLLRAQMLSDISALCFLGIDDNDVTAFYYSGHGGRTSAKESGIGSGHDLLHPSLSAFAGDASGDGVVTFIEAFNYADAGVDAFRGNCPSLGITRTCVTPPRTPTCRSSAAADPIPASSAKSFLRTSRLFLPFRPPLPYGNYIDGYIHEAIYILT